jgi:hypothetical protein
MERHPAYHAAYPHFPLDPVTGLTPEQAEAILRLGGWSPERDLGAEEEESFREACAYYHVPLHPAALTFVRSFAHLGISLCIPVDAKHYLYNGIQFEYEVAHHAYTAATLRAVMADHQVLLSPIGYSYGTSRALLIDEQGQLYEYYEWYDPALGDPFLSAPYTNIHDYLQKTIREIAYATAVWIKQNII